MCFAFAFLFYKLHKVSFQLLAGSTWTHAQVKMPKSFNYFFCFVSLFVCFFVIRRNEKLWISKIS